MAGDFDQSRVHAEAAAHAAADLAASEPLEPDYVELEVHAQRLLALVAERTDKPAVAESQLRRAIELQEQLLHEPNAPPRRANRWLDELVDLDRSLVRVLLAQDRPGDAQIVVEHSIAALVERRPGGRAGELLADQYHQLADVLTQLNNSSAAAEATTKAEELRRPRREGPPRPAEPPRAGDNRPRDRDPRDRDAHEREPRRDPPRPDPRRPDGPPPPRRGA